MKSIVYSCPFVPAELIAAHGLRPVRLLPTSSSSGGIVPATEGICPYMRSFINEACMAKGCGGIILTTACDQMRRAADFLNSSRFRRPVFLLNVPSTWETHSSNKLYLAELKRLDRFLLKIGTGRPSAERLEEVMLKYDVLRSALLSHRESFNSRAFSEKLADFNALGILEIECFPPDPIETGIPVALLGGPLFRRDFDLFDLVEKFGGRVALDATESGERTMPAIFDPRNTETDPFGELVEAYFETIPEISRRPNDGFYGWLNAEIHRRKIRGVILTRHVWCDKWHAEVYRLKRFAGIPLLDLDMNGETLLPRNSGRIKAFMEMLNDAHKLSRKRT